MAGLRITRVRVKGSDAQRIRNRLVIGARAFGEKIFEESQRNVPVDKGTLKKSGVFEEIPLGFRISYRTSYAAVQEEGMKPGTVQHVKRHQVRAHERRYGGVVSKVTGKKVRRKRMMVKAHYVGPFSRTYKRGILGKHYVGNAYRKHRPRLASFIARGLAELGKAEAKEGG